MAEKEKKEIVGISLADFLAEIDAHIEDIESGEIKANPLAPIDINVVEESKKEVLKVTSGMLDDIVEEGIIGSPVKRIVNVVYPDGVKKRYANAVVAAEFEGVYKVTARNYAKNNKLDDKGNTWSYESDEEEEED